MGGGGNQLKGFSKIRPATADRHWLVASDDRLQVDETRRGWRPWPNRPIGLPEKMESAYLVCRG